MYLPDHFKEVDPAEIASIISGAPLACVVAHSAEGLVANHVPLMLDKGGDLIGHFALAKIIASLEMVSRFRSSFAVSIHLTNRYPSKQEYHRHVPTWNYQVLHIHGTIKYQYDVRSKKAAICLLTQKQERRVNSDKA
ncbi:FMN-binding negative transcriptional regulator [Devosia sp.]|uniref:FMN-binding negative transcriptional regulator n=1 Tax=Devosia sp. TaxID=1871048 RepID=UPI001ACAA8A3|nr:FMN-binding negative transcriptional regulator [Devosia sp.]MBN9332703.1 FMN-binding negative transcriptional regulator [Devosia sp.]